MTQTTNLQLQSDRLRGETKRNSHGSKDEKYRDQLANELYPEDNERRNAFTAGWNQPKG